MPKIDTHFKEEISQLSKVELVKLVIKGASISTQFYDYLIINYVNTVSGEKDLFEIAKNDIKLLFLKSYKGYSDELRMANMLASCNKRIVEFSKVCKNKSLEMDLIMMVLEIPFSSPTNSFATCFTKYNYQVYLLVKKAITLLKTKLHEDFQIEYAPKLNEYITILHKTSSHLDYVYEMPKSV